MYSESYKKHLAKHTEEETWDKLSEMEHKVLELEERHKYLTAMQTEAATENTTPTTISVPNAQLTEASSILILSPMQSLLNGIYDSYDTTRTLRHNNIADLYDQ
mmetsp:Transcript_2896/g.6427  ORF Transcript_2896/g.6427 Transcript_2896/m.6427 type:complete len:104 (-) Transcript_2896:135-446(-)